MPLKLIAKVAVSNTTFSFDKQYTYLIPEKIQDNITPGMRVLLPFGGGNKKRQALILSISKENIPDKLQLKSITEILDSVAILTSEQVSLAIWLKEHCFCTYFDAFSLMIPSGIHYDIQLSYELIDKDIDLTQYNLTDIEISVLQLLKKHSKLKAKEIAKKLSLDKNKLPIDTLIQRALIKPIESAKKKLSDTSEKTACLNEILPNVHLTAKQKLVYDFIKKAESASIKEIIYYTGVTKAVLNSLVKKNIIDIFDSPSYKIPYDNLHNDIIEEINLTQKQHEIYKELEENYNKNKCEISLLYGITGSGKTKVFTKLIDKVIADGKDVILMVPEISLTSHMIRPFKERYGKKVAVYHSSLSMSERMDEWKRCKEGKAQIVLGTRSAVFVPFSNIGLIIMDEEQEYSYKSEASPRFNAKDVAKFRANKHNALLLFSSATPSLESYHKAKNKRYSLHILNERYGKAQLPQVIVADMNKEIQNGNKSSVSSVLYEALEQNMQNNKQSVLLLNRRGYNTFVRCRECNEVLKCGNCSLALRYHIANNRLMCHCCGYSMDFLKNCPNCGGKLIYSGEGTQHIETDIKELFPNARILRLDADSTSARFSFDKKFESFKNKEYDIMLGTQMVAKGLDFPDVTLVGVINADQSLYGDDFRSYERAFSLITQVVGRAGRSEQIGKAIIQTCTPENNIINLAAKQDYDCFYNSEIQIRKMLLYPPFTDICMIGFSGKNQALTHTAADDFFKVMTYNLNKEYRDIPIKVFTPVCSNVIKLNSKYRYKIVIKCRDSSRFREFIAELLVRFGNSPKYKSITAFADMNPYSIL